MQALEAYAQSAISNSSPKRFEVPEKVKIRHILILLAEPNAREQAEQLLKDIKAGADFDALARAVLKTLVVRPKGVIWAWLRGANG